MPDLSARRQLFRAILAVLLALDVAAIVYLVSPLGESHARRQEERDRIQQQILVRQREVVPLKNIDQKLATAQKEIADFYAHRLPGQYAAIPEELGKVAQEQRVRISQARYSMDDADVPGLRRVSVEAGLDGDYLQIVKFINALERDKIFFIVNSVALTEQQSGVVRLQVKLETYLKA